MNTRHTSHRSDSFRFFCLALCTLGALLLALTLLPGCGGGNAAPPNPGAVSGNAPPPQGEPTPIALTATLASAKRLTLNWSWSELASVQTARILQDPDGDGPLPAEPLADVPAANGTATVDIFLPVALQASYRVALCDGGQCTPSDPLRLQGSLELAMGRFKADTPLQNAEFGMSLALSQDGKVMAVGDTSGTVHLFERSGPGPWASHGPVAAPSPAADQILAGALALSADGSVLAFGSGFVNSSGAAYVYRRQGNQWLFERHLQGSELGPDDQFGSSLALSGDGRTLAVGAPTDDGPADSRLDDGAVYVFTENSGQWTETLLLRDSNSAGNEGFGTSLALNADGTVLAVGSANNSASGVGVHAAPIDDANAPRTGAVYVYTRLPGNGSLDAFIKPPMDLGTGAFGSAVALDAQGNTLVVAAREADIDANGLVSRPAHSNSGSVHVFARSGGGQWAPQGAPLRSPVPRRSDEFGRALALSADGQTVVIGTQYNDYSGLGVSTAESPIMAIDAGSAYVFRRQASGWESATILQPSDHSTTGDRDVRLGSAVAISGDGRTVAVGARSHGGPGSGVSSDPAIAYGDDPAFASSGAVFLY
jgi:trimeric autotransporter adhesin